MEQQRLGGTVKSWVWTGANLPLSADQVHAAFGAGTIAAPAAKASLNPRDLAARLPQALPQAINKLTPNGVVQPA